MKPIHDTHESAPLEATVRGVPRNSAPDTFLSGRFGLRAGYGILIFIVAFLAIAFFSSKSALAANHQWHEAIAVQTWNHAHPNGPKHHFELAFTPTFTIVNDGVSFFGLLLLCFLFSKGERRPMRSYGIGTYRIADILPGAFWGLAMLSGVVAVLHAKRLLVFEGQNLHGFKILTYGAGWMVAFLFVGFSEEYTFRGYIQYTLMRGVWGLAESISSRHTRAVAFWIAGIFWSLMFGAAHMSNGGENLFGLVQVVLAGITFTYALWHTGSLWWGIGFHMTWDWAQSFLFGVADSGNISIGRLFLTHPQGRQWLSGGAAGPEGSIFATVALILTIVVVRFTTRPGTQPRLEQEPRPGVELHSIVA